MTYSKGHLKGNPTSTNVFLRTNMAQLNVVSSLFQEEFHGRPKMAQLIHQLANYDGGVEPNLDQEGKDEDGKKKKKVRDAVSSDTEPSKDCNRQDQNISFPPGARAIQRVNPSTSSVFDATMNSPFDLLSMGARNRL